MLVRLVASVLVVGTLAVQPAEADHGFGPCQGIDAETWHRPIGVADPAADLRVYAVQTKQDLDNVFSYDAFRRKIECTIRRDVMPSADADDDGMPDRPTIVAFQEDLGLATLGTGTRGRPARLVAEHGRKDPNGYAGAQDAFATLAATYAPAISYLSAREPDTSPPRLILAAATDMFARGFMQTMSDLARRYGVYIVASNNQAEFRATSDPAALAAFMDPDLAPLYAAGLRSVVYEPVDQDAIPETIGAGRAGIDVYNQAFMWAPVQGVTGYAQRRFSGVNGGPLTPEDPRANIIHVNKKTPLTSVERTVLDLSDDRDTSVANTGPFGLLPEHDPQGEIRIGYGISLPAFMWGTEFGQPLAAGTDPCETPLLWMRCLDARGVNLFLQPEANPGMWAEYIDCGWSPCAFQALSWLDSAWRAVADPTVTNIRYAVTPHLVGNLIDLTFDGQSAIFERCLPRAGSDTCQGNTATTFAGARDFVPCGAARCDDARLELYTGPKRESIVLAPWVLEDCAGCDAVANRERLAERARAMQAGTGSPYENAYLEITIWADLDFD